jgi:integrase
MNNYTIPKLYTAKNNLSKDWYVYFYYTHERKKKLFKYRGGINYVKTKKEKVIEGNALVRALAEKLESGWNPFTNDKTKSEDKTLVNCIDEVYNIKCAYMTPRSQKTYYDQLNLFKKWLKLESIDHLYVQNVRREHIRSYLDWLLGVKKYTGKTHNGHLSTIKTFFNEFVERKYIEKSPVHGFKMLREEVGKNNTYSEHEEKLFEEIMTENPNFYLATRFVRYCFFRRSELSKIQVKHINWQSKTIIVPSENAKNRSQDSVTIPKTLERLIIKHRLMELDQEMYLFGKDFKPSPVKLNRVDDYTDFQREINRRLGIKKECTFYSWKHTGAVELYQRTKDVYVVMRQCRHSDIKVTMRYLRSLGCMVSEQVREW